MASEIKIISQARDGKGTPKTWDYKPGGKHPAEANQFYKIVVDGKEELPVGTKIARKGNSVVFDFPDGTNFTLDDWCSVSDSRITDLINGQAYSTTDSAYVSAKDIDSGTCVIWGDVGQAGAVLGDGGVAPVTTTAAPPVGGDDHTAAAIIGGVLGLGALAALAHSGDDGGGSGDKQKPTIGTPDAVNEDFAPLAINAASIKANDDSGASNVRIVSAKIKSATGFDFSDDSIDANDDVKIVNNGGQFTLELNDTGANKFGSVTTTIEVQDAAGNKTSQDVVFVVNEVNDVPVNQAPANLPDLPFYLETVNKTNGLILSVNDADAGPGPENFRLESVVLTATEGTLTIPIAGDGNLTITNNNTGSLTLTGTQARINEALDSIVYNAIPLASTTRDVTIQMTSTDKQGEVDADSIVLNFQSSAGSSSVPGNGGAISMNQLFSSGVTFTMQSAQLQPSSVSSLIGDQLDQVPQAA
jgi:hypothetical protein